MWSRPFSSGRPARRAVRSGGRREADQLWSRNFSSGGHHPVRVERTPSERATRCEPMTFRPRRSNLAFRIPNSEFRTNSEFRAPHSEFRMSRLILNPVSGTDDGPSLVARINELLREQVGDLDITITAGPGDAERAAFRAASGGETRLYVAGGDGTLNDVLNGAYASGRLADIVFGLLPIGTAND